MLPRFTRRLTGLRKTLLLVALVLLAVPAATATAAGDGAEFYKGKTINFIVPYKAGGGYDTYSRLLAPALEKHTGARVIILNHPGGGGLLGVNEVFTAKPDGLTIGIQNAVAAVTNQVAGVEGVQYDMTKFSWLGRLATNPRVLAMRSGSDYLSIEKLLAAKEPVKLGATGLGGSTYVDTVITRDALGLPIEVVHGYDSSKEIDMGILRKEVDGCWGSYSSRAKRVKNGEQVIILQSGKKRHPKLPDVPTWFEIAKTEKGKRLLTVLEASHGVGRPVAGPPGIPAERLAFLQQAFDKAAHDEEFLKAAKKAKTPVDFLSGPEMAQLAEEALVLPEDVKKTFIQAIKGDI